MKESQQERCTVMSLLHKTQLKLKMNRSKNQKTKTLNQMKTQTLRQTQINSQLRIPPPESFKRIILQVRQLEKNTKGYKPGES
jgi:hypothetical protein